METKLIAAELATAAGCATVITIGSAPTRILEIILAHNSIPTSTTTSPAVEFSTPNDTLPPHTLFVPKPKPLTSRRFWILHGLTPRGSIYIDEGAYLAISRSEKDGGGAGNGGRLLAAGVIKVLGTFAAGQAVRVLVIKGRKRREEGSRPVSPDHFADRGRRKSLEAIAESGGEEELLREGEVVLEFGRGLSNYNSLEMNRVKGLKR